MRYSLLTWTLIILFKNVAPMVLGGFSNESTCLHKRADFVPTVIYDNRFKELQYTDSFCTEVK